MRTCDAVRIDVCALRVLVSFFLCHHHHWICNGFFSFKFALKMNNISEFGSQLFGCCWKRALIYGIFKRKCDNFWSQPIRFSYGSRMGSTIADKPICVLKSIFTRRPFIYHAREMPSIQLWFSTHRTSKSSQFSPIFALSNAFSHTSRPCKSPPNMKTSVPSKSRTWQIRRYGVMLLGTHCAERTLTSHRSHRFAYGVRGQSPNANRHLEYIQHSQIVWHEKWRSICSAVFSIALCTFHVFNFHLTIGLLHYTDDIFEKKSSKLLCLVAFILCAVCVLCKIKCEFIFRFNRTKTND